MTRAGGRSVQWSIHSPMRVCVGASAPPAERGPTSVATLLLSFSFSLSFLLSFSFCEPLATSLAISLAIAWQCSHLGSILFSARWNRLCVVRIWAACCAAFSALTCSFVPFHFSHARTRQPSVVVIQNLLSTSSAAASRALAYIRLHKTDGVVTERD